MHRKSLRRAAALMLVPALIACSKSSSTSTSPAALGGAGAAAYVKVVCTSMTTWLADIKARAAKLTSDISGLSDLQEGKQLLVTYMSDIVASTDTLINSIKDEGAPDVSGGADAQAALLAGFAQVRTLLAAAEAKMKALPTDSVAAFRRAAKSAGTSLTTAASGLSSSFGSLQNSELDAAFAGEPACAAVSSGS